MIYVKLLLMQINQVAKHPAIFCHDVCVIGWFIEYAITYEQTECLDLSYNQI